MARVPRRAIPYRLAVSEPAYTPISASPTTAPVLPVRLHLERTKELQIDWSDGVKSVFPLGTLRTHCPCASCKVFREEQATRKSRLTLLPGNYAGDLAAVGAQMVGNYALRIDWSDGHASGIYSFEFLAGLRGK